MKLSELKQRIDLWMKVHPNEDDPEVVICLDNPGMGAGRMEVVVGAGPGIDWKHGKYILALEHPVVALNPLKENLRDAAEAHLKRLRESHARLGFQYLKGKRAGDDWVTGFMEGVRQHVTSILLGDDEPIPPPYPKATVVPVTSVTNHQAAPITMPETDEEC